MGIDFTYVASEAFAVPRFNEVAGVTEDVFMCVWCAYRRGLME